VLSVRVHYVVPPTDAWDQTKFSLIYVIRPEYDTTVSDGKEWRSLDWHNRKFTLLRASHSIQSQDSGLTGRHGFIGFADIPSMTKPQLTPFAVAELAERFTYRCITAPMQNYIDNAHDDPLRPGALVFEHGAGLPGLIIALVLIGFGFGGIKSNVAPLIAEQYARKPLRIKTLTSGEKVIVDPNVTIQTIYGRYYWVINIGSLSVIPASWLELKVSFWAAFLLPLCFWIFPVGALAVGRGRYVVQNPSGSVLIKAMRDFWVGLKRGCNLDAAKPSVWAQTHPATTVPWDDAFVDELKRALVACSVFCVFPIFWVCYGQTNSNLVSQAATMKTYGIPNDMSIATGGPYVSREH
ncbi:oligopeptide transporter, partial [Aspergillus udagawae]